MSKKTRKKSSKPSPESRKTPAQKPVLAKTPSKPPGKAARRSGTTSAKKPAAKLASKAAKTATKTAARKSDKAAKTTSAKASHKPTSKQLIKSNLSDAPKPAAGTGLVEGAMAPPFSLPRDGGGSVSLADYTGKKLVLFFYPRADTPGCTREAIDFTRLKDAFADEGAAVLGVSADTIKAQESFRTKHQLSVPLISDEQHEMLEAYGAWGEKSMYGRNFMGIIRTTVVIGADGRIAKIWRNVRVDGHADEVLAAVRAI
ncbi:MULTISPECIES: peroxiredoxin [unclassified Bradyrhizobium]|uniref:peroxiredoxin n=1 Tax=unclassified Bradyrhizobium TaxID=2631580 RepID=UPI002FF22008